MAPPLVATGSAYLGSQPLLAGYLIFIALAAFAGGASISFLSLGHRRLQVLLSFNGGVLLGVGMLHLIPHAFLELNNRIDKTMSWVLLGFFVMFLLERAFHGHSH
ncbi:MAG: ZIP family metal transporter, partial [Pirellulales bacterium]|nr:ZIP family metal transporter [Pirellulales bacterium]